MKNLLVVLIFSFGLTSCLKEQDTIAQISVVDQVGSPVANAQVVLLGVPSISNPPTVIRHDTLFTNSAGIATFNYTEEWKLGSAGFAILDIFVKKTSASSTVQGRGVINVTPQEMNKEVVVMPCNGC